ncbi:MAG: NAD(P)/FAD-dependent oxidoreductase [Zetaproteobacteria bacterium]|nr:MAG: NAD(P)/FAD-dependent oxidoreductase [Zetaproteobacteria bacterium]
MSPSRFDAIIVGGGPAGSSCAFALRNAGWRVCIIDKKHFPRDKVCAGWVTPEVWDLLDIKPADYARDHVLQEIRHFRVGLIGGHAVEFGFEHAVSYGIRRCEFDAFLARRSKAVLIEGEQVRKVERVKGIWHINSGCWQAPVLVGAGGHFCPVARHLGARTGRFEHAVHAQEIEFQLPPAWRDVIKASCPELYFCSDLRGYGWLFRKGNWLNIGLGRQDQAALGGHVDAFIDWLVAEARLPERPAARMHGHAYLLASASHRKVVDDGVLLVGDAAGLAYGSSGEGIRPAVESGLMAARTLVRCQGDFSQERLNDYANGLRNRFGRGKMAFDWPVWLVRPWFRLPGFVRHFVIEKGFLRPGCKLTVARGG